MPGGVEVHGLEDEKVAVGGGDVVPEGVAAAAVSHVEDAEEYVMDLGVEVLG